VHSSGTSCKTLLIPNNENRNKDYFRNIHSQHVFKYPFSLTVIGDKLIYGTKYDRARTTLGDEGKVRVTTSSLNTLKYQT
jgi:hypothetical protein